MLGNFELGELDDGTSRVMLSLLWIVFSVIISVLLLNLLIANISYNFEKFYETSEHSYMMEKTKVVLLSNCRLSFDRSDKLEILLSSLPYIIVFKPYVYTEESTDKWAGRIGSITAAVNGTVNSVQADVTDLKQEVSNLKNMIEGILKAVKPTAQQSGTTGSVLVGNNDDHNAAATPLAPSTTAAAAEEVYQKQD
jgi:hypothetical protein